jgi:alpha-methylacyl-CoA racemase
MGPLAGVKIVEMSGLGPCPLCGMLLADLGADVLRIERGTSAHPLPLPSRCEISRRGRPSVAIDLRAAEGRDAVLTMFDRADAVIEGYRPGAMERLGLGPDEALARNPRLVYGRVTGWGQDGPLAVAAGHDINYIALTGALHSIGPAGHKPIPPLSLVGDFGGGTMLLAVGVLSALLNAQRTGQGQVVDAAMIDGAALLMSEFYGMFAAGFWTDTRGEDLIGGSHYYDTYETADGRYISIGAIEPQFYEALREKLGLTDPAYDKQHDKASWPALKAELTAIFKTRTRAQWCDLLEGTDVCFAPVLSMAEAPSHPHNRAREGYVDVEGVVHPSPAPRFSRTPLERPGPIPKLGADPDSALRGWGFGVEAIEALRQSGALPDRSKGSAGDDRG